LSFATGRKGQEGKEACQKGNVNNDVPVTADGDVGERAAAEAARLEGILLELLLDLFLQRLEDVEGVVVHRLSRREARSEEEGRTQVKTHRDG
jgi:hypothetical protein